MLIFISSRLALLISLIPVNTALIHGVDKSYSKSDQEELVQLKSVHGALKHGTGSPVYPVCISYLLLCTNLP